MKSLLLTLTLILAQQGKAPVTAPPAIRGSIRGIVKQPNPGEAIADVEITLTSASQGNAPSQQTLKIFAWDNLPNGAEENAEFMEKYESRGKLLSVSAGVTNANLTLDLIADDVH